VDYVLTTRELAHILRTEKVRYYMAIWFSTGKNRIIALVQRWGTNGLTG
jgi:iron only hydrogenase large subunit-like protein